MAESDIARDLPAWSPSHPTLSPPLQPSDSAALSFQQHVSFPSTLSTPTSAHSSLPASTSVLSSSASSPSSLPLLPAPLWDVIRSNPVFSGGAGLALVGVAAAVGRQTLRTGMELTRKYFTVSLEIPSKDRSYQWVLQWLSKQQQQLQQAQQQPRMLDKATAAAASSTASTTTAASSSSPPPPPPQQSRFISLLHSLSRQQHLGVETTFSQSPSGVVSTHFDFVPSPGDHTFWYRHRLIHYTRTREKSMIDIQTGSPWETLTLRMFGRNRNILHGLLLEAKEAALKRAQDKTIIYTSSGIDWRQFGLPRKKRPLSSVVLDKGVGERLLADFTEFLSSQAWYIERGVPYRRGYLLYGPPGSGKSSFIQALAGHMQYNICVLNLNERSLTDDKLAYLLATTPPRSLLLLEDVDAAFTHREGKMAPLTFSGLLNALDGVASTEERVVFLTTNHIERLDPALIRPGRVDVQQYIGQSSAWQRREMWRRFYGGREEGWERLGEQFVAEMAEVELSVAELQGFFLLWKGDAKGAVEASKEWRKVKEVEARRRSAEERERRRVAREMEQQTSQQQQQHQQPGAVESAHNPLQAAIQQHTPPSNSFIMSR